MALRPSHLESAPPPDYELADFENVCTLRIHHAGQLVHGPVPEYKDGLVAVYDYVDRSAMSLIVLDKMCESLGYTGKKKYYRVGILGKFRSISYENELWQFFDTTEVQLDLYLDAEVIQTQVGSSKTVNQTIHQDVPVNINENENSNANANANEREVFEDEADFWNNRTIDNEIDNIVENFYQSQKTLNENEHSVRVEKANIARGKKVGKPNQRVAKVNQRNEKPNQTEENEWDGASTDSKELQDSDYDMDSNDDSDAADDRIFDVNIDNDAEWAGIHQQPATEHEKSDKDSSDDDLVEEEAVVSSDGFDSELESEEEGREHNFPRFNPKYKNNPKFKLQMIFSCKKEFIDAMHAHGVATMRGLKITSNDKRRVYAKCNKRKEGCDWHMNCLKVIGEESFQLREYQPVHKCGTDYYCQNVTSAWLAKKYEATFRSNPNRSVKGFREDCVKETKCHVSKIQAYRAKQKALKAIQGTNEEQYGKLWDYAQELRNKNPGSTVILQQSEATDISGKKKFEKLYICLSALKKGFLAGCRPIIGIDGAFLKGPHPGWILSAIAIDPNNCLYPIAYAVVCKENYESWEWFLNLLREDLQIEKPDCFTFVSDRQKGLIKALDTVFPGSDTRFCVRHMLANMKSAGYRGDAFKNALWNAATASTVQEFERRMKELHALNPKVIEFFGDKPPYQWSRSHFNPLPKCDILLNNACESFNKCILLAREKPILTMLEWIREYIMVRLQKMRDRAQKRWAPTKRLCPKVKKIVETNMRGASDCIPIKSDNWHYEIHSSDGTKVAVDLKNHSCACRKWDLCGIPCKHGMSAILAQCLDPEDFVNPCYYVETFLKVYEPAIGAMNGLEFWEKTGYLPPMPPDFGKKRGRPKKNRKLEVDEPVSKTKKVVQKMKKQHYHVVCKGCGVSGHNKRGCPKTKQGKEDVLGRGPVTKLTGLKRSNMTQITIEEPSVRSEFNINGQAPVSFRPVSCGPATSSSQSSFPILQKGRKNFVTLPNLSAAISETSKSKKNAN